MWLTTAVYMLKWFLSKLDHLISLQGNQPLLNIYNLVRFRFIFPRMRFLLFTFESWNGLDADLIDDKANQSDSRHFPYKAEGHPAQGTS